MRAYSATSVSTIPNTFRTCRVSKNAMFLPRRGSCDSPHPLWRSMRPLCLRPRARTSPTQAEGSLEMIKRVLFTLITLAVLIGGGLMVARSLRAVGNKDQNQYRLAKVKADQVKKTVTATGVLKA